MNITLLLLKALTFYAVLALGTGMNFNGLLSKFESQYIADEQHTPHAIFLYVCCAVIILAHPYLRMIEGALGFVQQYFLRNMFYANNEDVYISELNDEKWPVDPVYISCATQHDVTNAADYIMHGEPQKFDHFEVTPHHWGSYSSGFWKVPKDFRLSSAMEVSGAATSGSIGSALPRSQSGGYASAFGDVITGIMVLMGAETGRHLLLRQHGRKRSREYKACFNTLQVSCERIPELLMVTFFCICVGIHLYLQSGMVRTIFAGMPAMGEVYFFVNGSSSFEDTMFADTVRTIEVWFPSS